MRRKRILWQLYPSYLLVILVSLAAVTWYASRQFRQFYLDRTAADLHARILLVEEEIRRELSAGRDEQTDSFCKKLSRASTRITVILPGGRVVGDTDNPPAEMDNHADRKEIRQALAEGFGRSQRFSHTLREELMYVAVPIEDKQKTIGVLRASIPVTSIDRALAAIQLRIAAAGLVVALFAAGVSWFISRQISWPLEELKHGAERFARGDLAHKLSVEDTREIGALAETMNQMAAELDGRIRDVVSERNQRDAILASMVEGVLAVDAEQHLISLNQAAARMLAVDARKAPGRSLREVVRNRRLQALVDGAFSGGDSLEDDIVLGDPRERFVHANASLLCDADGRRIGVLVVLHDVTELQRVDKIRRDFVANVSHELRTPVTSVKGFVETLLDDAIDKPEDARRFLTIVAQQTDRLSAIIEDLLTLSRIEQDAEKAELAVEDCPLKSVLEAALGVCRNKAARSGVALELSCAEELRAEINPPLLEQAVINLVDNAVNYSGKGSAVDVEAGREDGSVVIRVRDRGCGIPPEHLPRLFERFYRVDKARSRKLGGTGLGLAIVKHIAQAHGGRASVESTPGVGSTFSLHLPGAGSER